MNGLSKREAMMTDALKKVIAASGESILSIARSARIPQPVLCRFMAGKQDLTLRTAEKLARYFNLELRVREK
jgi:hypothetical protein